ncbi:hypothetical protein ACFL5U_01540 [Candidatus Margulisiibacteriota bacterium]
MEALGLLDTLESIILDSTKVPFSKKLIIDEEKVLGVIDKMRLVIQGGGGFAKEAIASKQGARDSVAVEERQAEVSPERREIMEGRTQEEAKAVEVLQQAYQMAKEIRDGADKYADQVLSNLEATSTRILRSVRAGRERLEKTTTPAKEKV